jgi:23S rRNA pseudouridine2457 synthase
MHTSYFIIFKPYNMLSQFSETPEGGAVLKELADFPKDVYPVGRLDKDSEGLLILTNDKQLNNLLLNPKYEHVRTYWVQVDGIPTGESIQKLEVGVTIEGYKTRPAKVEIIEEPLLPPRDPPIRYRKNLPTSWIMITLIEGKNRQVRKMTAAVGFPTLRLIRSSIEGISLQNMQPGDVVEMKKEEIYRKLKL